MAFNDSTPANKRAGVKKGSATAAENKKSGPSKGFDSGYSYAEFAKTKVGIGADKKKG